MKNKKMIPIVNHFDASYDSFQLLLFSPHSEELAAEHGQRTVSADFTYTWFRKQLRQLYDGEITWQQYRRVKWSHTNSSERMIYMKRQVMILDLSVLLYGCGGKSVEKEDTGAYANDNGEKATARVKSKNDKIAEVKIDETAKGKDKTKKELDEDYGVKQASPIKKE